MAVINRKCSFFRLFIDKIIINNLNVFSVLELLLFLLEPKCMSEQYSYDV